MTDASYHPTCINCALHSGCSSVGIGGEGPQDPDILVVGGYPNKRDDLNNAPFHQSNSSAESLRDLCKQITDETGLTFRFTNVVRCTPYEAQEPGQTYAKTRKPKPKEISACMPWYRQEEASCKPKVIVPVGAIATAALLGPAAKISEVQGKPVWKGEQVYVAIYDPMNMVDTQYGGTKAERAHSPEQYREWITEAMITVANVASGNAPKQPEMHWEVAENERQAMEIYHMAAAPSVKLIGMDIETNTYEKTQVDTIFKPGLEITSIGLSWELNRAYVIPLQAMPQQPVQARFQPDYLWQRNYIHALWKLKAVFAGQNFMYDLVALCIRYKVPFWRAYTDVMLMHHLLWTHLPHGLDALSRTWTPFGGYTDEMAQLVSALPVKMRGYHCVPFPALARKNGYDAAITWDLANRFSEMINADPGLKWYYENVTIPVTKSLMQMSLRGMQFNPDLAREVMVMNRVLMFKLKSIISQHPAWQKAEELLGESLKLSKPLHRQILLFHPECGGHESTKNSKTTGLPSTDKSVLEELAKTDVLALAVQKIRSIETTESKTLRPMPGWVGWDGRVHPEYKVHGTRTTRLSCIAEGTPIEMPRNLVTYPKGIPIEQVKQGDFVYSYDREGRLSLQEVTWAGQTGVRKTVGIRWQSMQRKREDTLYVTPEHLVRMIDGSWRHAEELKPGDRMMALSRGVGGYGYPRLYPIRGKGIREHVFIAKHAGYTSDYFKEGKHHVHHEDHNKLNNSVDNLTVMTGFDHTQYHINNTPMDEFVRRGKASSRSPKWKAPPPQCGPDNINYKHISKWTILRMLAKGGGRVTLACKNNGHDFEVIKRKCKDSNIDTNLVRMRYDADGRYISAGRLLRVLSTTVATREIREKLRTSFYNVQKLCKLYGVVVRNHIVLDVCKGPVVPVYDIEVANNHCFIANEIAVHNSAKPNMQNQGKAILYLIEAEDGYVLVVCDISQAEMRVLALVTLEPFLIDAFNKGVGPDGGKLDIHAMVGAEFFNMDYEQLLPGGDSDARRDIKALNFGLVYGMTKFGLAVRTNKTPEEAQYLIDKYFDMMPRIKTELFDSTKQELIDQGFIKTVFGLYWHMTDGQKLMMKDVLNKSHHGKLVDRSGRVVDIWEHPGMAEVLRQAANCKVQGPANNIVQMGLIKFEKTARMHYGMDDFITPNLEVDLYLDNEIHDSVVLEVRKDLVVPVGRMLKECLETPHTPFKLPVPWVSDCKSGPNMGSLKELEVY